MKGGDGGKGFESMDWKGYTGHMRERRIQTMHDGETQDDGQIPSKQKRRVASETPVALDDTMNYLVNMECRHEIATSSPNSLRRRRRARPIPAAERISPLGKDRDLAIWPIELPIYQNIAQVLMVECRGHQHDTWLCE